MAVLLRSIVAFKMYKTRNKCNRKEDYSDDDDEFHVIRRSRLQRKFVLPEQYEAKLAALKHKFEKKWNTKSPSANCGLLGFEICQILGTGSFGQVRVVQHIETGFIFAVKTLLKRHIVEKRQVANLLSEKRILQSIEFPFLISIVFSRKDNNYLYIGLPVIGGGVLFNYLQRVRRLKENQARFYAAQVFLALQYLHHIELLYRDLKPENILIDAKGYIRITDFGFTKRVTGRTLSFCGTPEYIAPEIIKATPYGSSVDWWSFGILLYELVAGNSPFYTNNPSVFIMYEKICKGEYVIPKTFSKSFKHLISNLLELDVSKRYGCSREGNLAIKNHSWFENINWYAILNQEISAPYTPGRSNLRCLKEKNNIYPGSTELSTQELYHNEFLDF